MMNRAGKHSQSDSGGGWQDHPWLGLAAVMLAGLLMLTACGPQPTPAPTTVQAAATAIAPTVAAARSAVAPTVQAAQTQVVGTVAAEHTAVAPTIAAAQTQVAPTVAAVQTQVGATVSAVAPTVAAAQTAVRGTVGATQTAIAPTVAAAQTQIAPTVAAAQTQVAPTVAAAQTQIVATFGPPIATSTAASAVQITAAQISQENSTIVVLNSGSATVNLSGWILMLGTFPLVMPANPFLRIEPGKNVTLHLTSGTNSATDFYLGQAPPGLVNSLTPGTRLALINLLGQVASIYQIP